MNRNTAADQASELVDEGIAALISGRKAQARSLLGKALQADPHSEKGWLWLSGAVDSDEERRFCLRQVLSINEWNPAAQKGLKELGPGFARSPIVPLAPAAKPAPPTAAKSDLPTTTKPELPTTMAEPEPLATTAQPAPPTGEALAWSQFRPETDLTKTTAASVPKTWLIAAAILVAGLMVGLALLFVISTGILGK